MKKAHLLIMFLAVEGFISCGKVPLSNRRQLNLLPESTMIGMSLTDYKTFLTQHPATATADPGSQLVDKVGRKIAAAVTQYMAQQKMSDRIQGYNWEFHLVNDPQVNAWCMPGGKVVVYSGLLPVTQDETGLAVVLGHEISHAVARHGNERMSQMLMVQAGGMGLDMALQQKPQLTHDIFMTAYGAGSQLGVLTYSRTQESEADKLGLIFMAMAGYNPQNAVTFWQRMSSQGGAKPPEILSTHPSDATRIKDIQKAMPMAMKYYSGPK